MQPDNMETLRPRPIQAEWQVPIQSSYLEMGTPLLGRDTGAIAMVPEHRTASPETAKGSRSTTCRSLGRRAKAKRSARRNIGTRGKPIYAL